MVPSISADIGWLLHPHGLAHPTDLLPNGMPSDQTALREGYVAVNDGQLYYREIGRGQPIVVLHGGPDFDHRYLLPDLDLLSDAFHLIYYDQLGRGRSSRPVQSQKVSIESEVQDLDRLRQYFNLERLAVLGHSWGALLAMEYAIRHPDRVSHLILMNSAPATSDDYMLWRQELVVRRAPRDAEAMKAISTTTEYKDGDLEADAEYYRHHFRAAVRQPEHLERIVQRLRLNFTKQGLLNARAIEAHLMSETWLSCEYDLLPKLRRLAIPTLVLHGDCDFISVPIVARVAQAIHGARMVVLPECGHFSYLECPDPVRREILGFFIGD